MPEQPSTASFLTKSQLFHDLDKRIDSAPLRPYLRRLSNSLGSRTEVSVPEIAETMSSARTDFLGSQSPRRQELLAGSIELNATEVAKVLTGDDRMASDVVAKISGNRLEVDGLSPMIDEVAIVGQRAGRTATRTTGQPQFYF